MRIDEDRTDTMLLSREQGRKRNCGEMKSTASDRDRFEFHFSTRNASLCYYVSRSRCNDTLSRIVSRRKNRQKLGGVSLPRPSCEKQRLKTASAEHCRGRHYRRQVHQIWRFDPWKYELFTVNIAQRAAGRNSSSTVCVCVCVSCSFSYVRSDAPWVNVCQANQTRVPTN